MRIKQHLCASCGADVQLGVIDACFALERPRLRDGLEALKVVPCSIVPESQASVICGRRKDAILVDVDSIDDCRLRKAVFRQTHAVVAL